MPSYLAAATQRRGLLGVALAVLIGPGRRVERRVLGVVVGVGAVELRVAEAGAQHVGVVQPRLHRLAQRDVGERPLLGVEHQVRKAERRGQDRLDVGRALEPRIRFDRQQVGEVVLPRRAILRRACWRWARG